MVLFVELNGIIISEMAKVKNKKLMEQNLKVIGKMVLKMVMVLRHYLIKQFIKVNGKIIIETEWE